MHVPEKNNAREPEWLLLLYLLPARHAPARVQAWRRLQRLGAVPLKNSAYVLPYSPEAREDFEWIKNDIVSIGGQAMVLTAGAPEAATRDESVQAFQSARADVFAALADDAATLLERSSPPARGRAKRASARAVKQAARRLRERFGDAVRVDFFGAPGRDRVADLLERIEQRSRKGAAVKDAEQTTINPKQYRGRTWLTRPRPGVDRMSSAWLIRRFIDPRAKFAFGDPQKPRPRGAVSFDTFDADFGHQGSHCTFETLCDRFGIRDEGARWIGRIVHDLDLKEDTYREVEGVAVGRLVDGLRQIHRDDRTLLDNGIMTFEALYQSFKANASATPKRRRSVRT